MTEDINLKEMERKVFRDSNQVGLMEIILGIFLFAIGGNTGWRLRIRKKKVKFHNFQR